MKKVLCLFVTMTISLITLLCVLKTNDDFIAFSANVDALAEVEFGGFGPMCSKTGVSGNYTMKRCGNCNGPYGKYAMDVVAFCQN